MPLLTVLMAASAPDDALDDAVRSAVRELPRDAELVIAGTRRPDVDHPRVRTVEGDVDDALAASDSEVVAVADADDLVLPGRFRRQLHALQACDAVFTTTVERSSAPSRPAFPGAISPRAFPLHLLLSSSVARSTMAVRRDRLESAGGWGADDLLERLALDGARLRRLAVPSVVRHSSTADPRPLDGPPATSSAFAALSERLIGAPHQPVAVLAAAPLSVSARLSRFADFERRIRAAAAPLAGIERMAISLLLHRQAEWLWQRMLAVAIPEFPIDTRAGAPA